MIGRKTTGFFIFFLVLLGSAGMVSAAVDKLLPKSEVGDNGLHIQPWFLESFLDLREDLREATKQGKRLVIIWEQRGCPYCKRVHDVNLRIPRLVDYLKKNFVILQLDLWGDREVTDFDGKAMPEKKLSQRYGIRYTPALQFFPETVKEMAGKKGRDREVHRMIGYFHPYHFITTFEFVYDKAYVEEPNLQRYLISKGRALRDAGIVVDLMADELPPAPKAKAQN